MFAESDVHRLLHDARLKPPVLSMYLNTDRGTTAGEQYLASFRALLHEADQELGRRRTPESALARARLQDALPGVLAALDTEIEPQHLVRGAAFFISVAGPPEDTQTTPPFTLFTLPRPVRNQSCVEQRPYIRPLLFLLDQYERVGVVVADRNHARIFTLFLGEIESVARRVADTPRRHHQGGWKQMLLQRDVDGHVKAHIRATIREAVNRFGVYHLKRVVLGGSDETLGLLRSELPERFRSLIAGTFHADPHASDTDITTRALALAQAAEHHEEEQRVQELLEALARRPGHRTGAAHHQATAGLPETLRALSDQRVQRLLIQSGRHVPGATCENCGLLSADTRGHCENCRQPLRPVPDILELAVERARAQKGEVEFVTESPSLEGLGGVGALLRY